MNQTRPLPPLPWTVETAIRDPDTNLTVRVKKQALTKPRYSLEIGRTLLPSEGREERFAAHFPLFVDIAAGKATAKPFIPALIALLEKASAYVQNEAQDAIYRREVDGANRGKPETRSTGKTAKKRAAGK